MSAPTFALAPLWTLYKGRVFTIPSSDALFNLYRDEVDGLDVDRAAQLRQRNLRDYLRAFPAIPPILIVGEAPGPWGCRFTGVPFTSERQFAENSVPFKGRKTSANGLPYAERTASIFWSVMAPYFPRFLIWSTVPFHPHLTGEPLSIRPPKPTEVREHISLMVSALEIVQPKHILAVGRVAQKALTQLEQTFIPIRHPSHGGATEFRRGMEEIFESISLK